MLDLPAHTAERLSADGPARVQLLILAQLLAVTGGVAAVATRCPACREEDGLIIRLAAGSLARCIMCGFRTALAELLRPVERPGQREEIRRMMTARPRGR